MIRQVFLKYLGPPRAWLAVGLILAGACVTGRAWAEGNAPSVPNPPADGNVVTADQPSEGGIVQTGCQTCRGGRLGCGSSCYGGAAPCYPGGKTCDCCLPQDTCAGRFLACLYECLCCPDPCYEPQWLPVANAAFFVDAPRPRTYTRLRVDLARDFAFPDRAEYFWARERVDGNQVLANGQNCPRFGSAKGPRCANGERSLDYNELSLYTEAASGGFGFFVEAPYRRIDPELCPCDKSGFGDLNLGTKTVLLDCELLLLTFQFRTFVPSGDFTTGLGTGHVSLEPSLLTALRITPDLYFQGQAAYWIPVGGDDVYAGPIFHYHLSLNKILCCPCEDIQLIGTAELDGWAILDGAYTDPDFLLPGENGGPDGLRPVARNARDHFLTAGGGIRLAICDRIDFGFGAKFALTDDHFADQIYRFEFRLFY
jgi:hypothetical protein